MNQKEFDEVVNETTESIRKLLAVKGGEYAGKVDRLSNFKRGASLCSLQPLTVLFVYLSKHYDALASFVRKTEAGESIVLSEPIESRLDDIITYCILAKALIEESRRQSNRGTSGENTNRLAD